MTAPAALYFEFDTLTHQVVTTDYCPPATT
jgi:hypothetical protein